MKVYIQDGKTVDLTATKAVLSGGGFIVGPAGEKLFAVAVADIANGEVGAAQTEGVFALPKDGTDAFVEGEAVFWDDTANTNVGQVQKTASGFSPIGTCVKAAGASDTTVWVKLYGDAQTLVP